MEIKMNLHEKLIEIRKTVTYLKKENKGYNYNFVSSSQTLASVREKMDELGVLLIPSVSGSKVLQYQSAKEGNLFLTELDLIYKWVDSKNPQDTISCPFYAQGADNAEKGVGKAYTYGEKYFILKFFNIPTDKDDPDTFQDRNENGVEKKAEKPPRESSQNKNAQHDKGTFSDYIAECIVGKSGNTNGKAWQVYIIRTQENGEVATYEKKVYDACCVALGDGVKITLNTQPGKHGPVVNSAQIEDDSAA